MDPEQTPSTIPAIPQHEAKKTWPWIVLILILLVGLSFLGWWLYEKYKPKPAPVDPMDVSYWQTYESINLGATVKYPETASFQILEKSIIFTDQGQTALVLNFEKNNNPLFDLAYLVNDRKETFLHPRVITLDGKLAYEGVDVGSLNYYGVYALHNSYLVRFDFPTANKDSLADLKKDLSQVQNSMLESINFLPESLETANWKTYTNNLLKYSVKFPADWEYKEINESTVGFTSSKEKWEIEGERSYPIKIRVSNTKDRINEFKKKINTSVSNVAGTKYTGVPGLLNYTNIIVPKGEQYFNFEVEEGTDVAKTAGPIFNPMLSTFKFSE